MKTESEKWAVFFASILASEKHPLLSTTLKRYGMDCQPMPSSPFVTNIIKGNQASTDCTDAPLKPDTN
jgi:hypothetical protein